MWARETDGHRGPPVSRAFGLAVRDPSARQPTIGQSASDATTTPSAHTATIADITAPGDSMTWTVRWKLRRLPGGTTVAAGNADLASFTAAALAE